MKLPPPDVVAAFFLKHLPSLYLDERKALRCGEKPLKNTSGLFGFLYTALSPDARAEMVVEIPEAMACIGVATYGKELQKSFSALLSEETDELDLGSLYYPDIPHPLSELEYVFNQMNPDKSFLWHPASGVVYEIASKLVEDTLSRILNKNYGKFLASNSCQRLIQYHPFKERDLVDPLRPGQKVYNAWQPAKWDVDWRQRKLNKEACPEIFARFLRHLFPDDVSRKAAEAWHRDACFGKAGCVLVLAGTAGSGKTTFIDIAKNLVGVKNYTRCNRKFFESQFQGIIANHRLAVFDELRVTPDIRDTLKDFLEPEATFNEKFEVMKGVKKLSCSMVLASNYSKGISLEYTDRKFSVPDIAKQDLKDVWAESEILELIAAVEDPIILHQYASYLFHTYRQGDAMKIPKGARFERLCLNSIEKGLREIIETWQKGASSVTSAKINRNHSASAALLASEVAEFLESYEQSRKVKVGNLTAKSIGRSWEVEFHGAKKDTEEEFQF